MPARRVVIIRDVDAEFYDGFNDTIHLEPGTFAEAHGNGLLLVDRMDRRVMVDLHSYREACDADPHLAVTEAIMNG